MNIFLLFCSILALPMFGIAWLALRQARHAGNRCAELETLILDADQRTAELEAQIVALVRADRLIVHRLDKLAADRGRVDTGVPRPGFAEAIALIEHGADAEELTDACGIGIAEARLVEVLYGHKLQRASGRSDREARPDGPIVVDANLNVVTDGAIA